MQTNLVIYFSKFSFISLKINLFQLRVASTLNFRNSEPAVGYKLSRIVSMQEGTEANNKLGSDLGNEANQFLQVNPD